MKQLELFDRVHNYEYAFQVKHDMEVISELTEKIVKPQILSYCGLEDIDFYISDDSNFICNDCIHWIYTQYKDSTKTDTIRDCLLKCASEDEEWTKERNKDLTGIFYRKITFLPEIQDVLTKKLHDHFDELNALYDELNMEEQKEEEKRNQRMAEWKLTKTYKKILPTGEEMGRDGYIDAQYTSKDGETIRMVNRDVFDVGCYSYPKRLEGSDEAANHDNWTDAEKSLARWLSEFGIFHGIRMGI